MSQPGVRKGEGWVGEGGHPSTLQQPSPPAGWLAPLNLCQQQELAGHPAAAAGRAAPRLVAMPASLNAKNKPGKKGSTRLSSTWHGRGPPKPMAGLKFEQPAAGGRAGGRPGAAAPGLHHSPTSISHLAATSPCAKATELQPRLGRNEPHPSRHLGGGGYRVHVPHTRRTRCGCRLAQSGANSPCLQTRVLAVRWG